ncbi:M50 family metallopeptidase [Rubripirellula amarantea]|uniref:ATP-dependent zinc metalloprotease FtsH n=1 Tax=Rubripirellula amarantea TaxID=2527999 RepID=A0A5C5WVH1_9BACT|nr:M50 family metallopeptidase [Rubripirellula amarantea]MDA8743737.1 M50 family metallopeptidase [Rubripirellula amarantea]TWT54608.1 ATP-dependent zinc metalloprotease FtsH [Rubripirellula amarantea]
MNDDASPSPKLIATAHHEAGHAVMAISLGRNIHKVTIKPGKSQFGTQHAGLCKLGDGRSKATKNAMEEEVLILLAGMVAESHVTGEYCAQGASEDLRLVQRLLCQRAGSESQHERMFRRLLDKAEHQLADEGHRYAVKLIANELIEKTTISGRAVRHFFQQAVK